MSNSKNLSPGDEEVTAEEAEASPNDGAQVASELPSGEAVEGTRSRRFDDGPHEVQLPPEGSEPLGINVDLKSLLEAGAHFGHQTHRWNPKMLPFIFGERNHIHIINLDKTLELWERARKYVRDISSQGGNILFVGTKQQSQKIVREEADRCGAFHVTNRWLGGMLSNFETIKRSIERMRKLEDILAESEREGTKIRISKKERLGISRELERLSAHLGGIRSMKRLPELLFVIDTNKEAIAVAEARKLRIPIVALVDTNSDPNLVDFVIPSNDDSVRTIKLFVGGLADAVIEGRKSYLARRTEGEFAARQRGNQSAAADGDAAVTKKRSKSRQIAQERGESAVIG